MKSIEVLGNWKSNKTRGEAKDWIQKFSSQNTTIKPGIRTILCPAFHHLDLFLEAKLPMALGVQDVSPYPSGAYTGEISASMLSGTVAFVLLGHSERRKYFEETDNIIAKKVAEALRHTLIPIVCISQISEATTLVNKVPQFMQNGLFLYEPLTAIGSGQADSPENADAFAQEVITTLGPIPVLYGGSVKPENAAGFFAMEHISGVGVGGASLDPVQFAKLIEVASSCSK